MLYLAMADIQFNLRIPAELKERIAESAKENNRSINAEAQSRLEKSFEPYAENSPSEIAEAAANIAINQIVNSLCQNGVNIDTVISSIQQASENIKTIEQTKIGLKK